MVRIAALSDSRAMQMRGIAASPVIMPVSGFTDCLLSGRDVLVGTGELAQVAVVVGDPVVHHYPERPVLDVMSLRP
ncbi:hypothetical protein [Komagataeibacter saccharivorans]|uniref:hypothetical protein n=1 Tax=Komagataeibacter saccharivorans TaxID=265959 RepID=UPI0013C34101|nr:hypothetical protein [Komagataeibacter saccharivorans]